MTDQQNAALEPCKFCGKGALPLNGHTSTRCSDESCPGAKAWYRPDQWNTRPAPAGAEAVREAWRYRKALEHISGFWDTCCDSTDMECEHEHARAAVCPAPSTGGREKCQDCKEASIRPMSVAPCQRHGTNRAALAKAPSTGEVNAGANEIRHLKEQIRQMFITIDKQAAALAAPQPAPTAHPFDDKDAVYWALARMSDDLGLDERRDGAIYPAKPDAIYDAFKALLMKPAPTAAEDGLREVLTSAQRALEGCRDNDKTPEYGYGKKDSLNRNGVSPGAGTRWATPREIAKAELERIEAALRAKPEASTEKGE